MAGQSRKAGLSWESERRSKAQTGLLGGQQAETQTSENPQREEE